MKKPYVKPQVYFEDFQLSASIAGNCAPQFRGDTNLTVKDINTCGYSIWGEVFFLNGVCDNTPQDGDLDNVCYDNPNETMKIFAS